MAWVCVLGRRWEGKSKVACGDQRHTNNTRYAFFFISKLRFLQELNARQLFCRLATGIFQHILKEIITGLFCPSLHPITCRTSTSSSGLFAWKLECWWGVILYNRLAQFSDKQVWKLHEGTISRKDQICNIHNRRVILRDSRYERCNKKSYKYIKNAFAVQWLVIVTLVNYYLFFI